MAIAVTSSPVQNPGSHRSFCESVQRSKRYGATTSVWMVRHEANPTETLASSSAKTALKRKSPASFPPYFSGTSSPRKPWRPASSQTLRSIERCAIIWSRSGTMVRATKVCTDFRNSSWSSSNSVRCMSLSMSGARLRSRKPDCLP